MMQEEKGNTVEKMSGLKWGSLVLSVIGWGFSIMVLTITFYQMLPVALVLLGSTIGVLGTAGNPPSIVDLSIFLLSGLSFTAVLTGLYVRLIKNIWTRMSVVRKRVSIQTRQRFIKKKTK